MKEKKLIDVIAKKAWYNKTINQEDGKKIVDTEHSYPMTDVTILFFLFDVEEIDNISNLISLQLIEIISQLQVERDDHDYTDIICEAILLREKLRKDMKGDTKEYSDSNVKTKKKLVNHISKNAWYNKAISGPDNVCQTDTEKKYPMVDVNISFPLFDVTDKLLIANLITYELLDVIYLLQIEKENKNENEIIEVLGMMIEELKKINSETNYKISNSLGNEDLHIA